MQYKNVPISEIDPELIVEAVKLYMQIQNRFPNTVLEVCEPRPDNPSPNIQPIFMDPKFRS